MMQEEQAAGKPDSTDEVLSADEAAVKAGPAQDGAPESAADEPGLEERLAELEAKNSEIMDQYLRKCADFDNYRKRMQREKEDAVRYANSSLILDLIPIIDDFERAIKSSAESKDFDSFYSGIELIERQFVGMLERNWGLRRFESVGEEFDPQRHEALHMVESPEHDGQVVLEDYQKGFILHDRVVRHSKVKVSAPKAAGEDAK